MMTALRLLGFRGTVAIIAITATLALAIRVDWLTADRDTARAQTVELTRANSMLSANLATARHDLRVVNMVLSGEKSRAVEAERQASELRGRIARDAGTERDGATAPVLRDTIEGLTRTRTRADELFLGRMESVHQLSVVVDGKLVDRKEIRGFRACRDLAAGIAVKLAKKPELIANSRRVSIRCDAVTYGDRT